MKVLRRELTNSSAKVLTMKQVKKRSKGHSEDESLNIDLSTLKTYFRQSD